VGLLFDHTVAVGSVIYYCSVAVQLFRLLITLLLIYLLWSHGTWYASVTVSQGNPPANAAIFSLMFHAVKALNVHYNTKTSLLYLSCKCGSA